MFLPHPRVRLSIVGSLRDREVACSASNRQGSNFESCVWRTVSSHSSHHPQEVLLAQFSLYVHKGGLKPDSFHYSTDLNSEHINYAKTSEKKTMHNNSEKKTCFRFHPMLNTHIFMKGFNILTLKKIYDIYKYK